MVQFLTRIPVPLQLQVNEEDFLKGLALFPAVGAIIGGVLSVLYFGLMQIFPPLTVLVLVIVAEIFITGGLHLDGLADSFDGLYSNRGKERILEIMKDSRIGANGVLALITYVLLKLGMYSGFEQEMLIKVVFLMPVASRMMVPLISFRANYARESGMGNLFIGKGSAIQLMVCMTYGTALIFWIDPALLGGLAACIVFTYLYRRHVERIIGGLTGDILGATIEMSNIVFLAGAYLTLGVIG